MLLQPRSAYAVACAHAHNRPKIPVLVILAQVVPDVVAARDSLDNPADLVNKVRDNKDQGNQDQAANGGRTQS